MARSIFFREEAGYVSKKTKEADEKGKRIDEFLIGIRYYCEKLAVHGVEYLVVDAIRDFRVAALDFSRVVLAYPFYFCFYYYSSLFM